MIRIAIVGMACRYPDARTPSELWENVLAKRRAFRRLPPERLCMADYHAPSASVPDRTYSMQAALLTDYEFDRVRFCVSGETYRSADMAHWLALDVASQALEDAGFPGGEGLPRAATGVVVGNTLTGEFSRAHGLRLRWPYVRRVVEAALDEEGWHVERKAAFLSELETRFKAPFAPVGPETLAGGLSNTIAGRICNHYDLGGGGYTIDGACSSSLLATANACASLEIGDIDVALAGGVDLSLDPFELVGFAKAGALASDEMRVYDQRSSGFWPGEGCGFLVLMRLDDAIAAGRRIYAVVRGWGISSDGSGGLTRPEVGGQMLALRRAYLRAGFGIDTVPLFEGHGTGTDVGDTTELRTLSTALRQAAAASQAAIGSVKANIGHTKAAAGVAGLIKATSALAAQVLPPSSGFEEPHPELSGETPPLRLLHGAEAWPDDRPLRAAVSAMGFGGINTHVVIEAHDPRRRPNIEASDRRCATSAQDCELFLLDASDRRRLRERVEKISALAEDLSWSDLTDLAATLAQSGRGARERAAVVAAKPHELAERLAALLGWLEEDIGTRSDAGAGIFLGTAAAPPRVGFLFPGQGAPVHRDAGAWGQRFPYLQQVYAGAELGAPAATGTALAQPAIVTASRCALWLLAELGVHADVGLGHSLGELSALHWAGAFDGAALQRIARVRGQAMMDLCAAAGAMASLDASADDARSLLVGDDVGVAAFNSASQTVISGPEVSVEEAMERARAAGFGAARLPVSHAFHSPLVAAAAEPLGRHLATESVAGLQRPVVSTVTGAELTASAELRDILTRQLTEPVRFLEAVEHAAARVDLFIEVGPGRILSTLAAAASSVPAVPLDFGSRSLGGLLRAAAALFAAGASIDTGFLFNGRLARPFDFERRPTFLTNPCELVAPSTTNQPIAALPIAESRLAAEGEDALRIVRRLVAARLELPLGAVDDNSLLLDDLHLNSISIAEIVTSASAALGLPPPVAPAEFASASIAGLAEALETLERTAGARQPDLDAAPAGVDTWVRPFVIDWVERPLPERQGAELDRAGRWLVLAPPNQPLADHLREALPPGNGCVVCLPPSLERSGVDLLLEGARHVLAAKAPAMFVLVQHGPGGASFARTIHLEVPGVTTCVIDVPPEPASARYVLDEIAAASGFTEVRYDAGGVRRQPVLRLRHSLPATRGLLPGPDDLLLVSGGGKGIAAECALDLARTTGVRLALLGRSTPDSDDVLRDNLERMQQASVELRYDVADVADERAVRQAVKAIEAACGPVTAILHGAGNNVPELLSSLDREALARSLETKVDGLRHLLGAIDPRSLRLLVTFGSIIARTGMRGEAHYALANEWQSLLTERWQDDHPACRCLAVEWSVWSGVGMGARLGRIEALERDGISSISLEQGVNALRSLLGQPLDDVSVVVAGRIGDPPTLEFDAQELPFLRFLEQPRLSTPGVELVVDVDLCSESDLYLDEHEFGGERLFPAVLGLEAMAQVAMAAGRHSATPWFEAVRFQRPIAVPHDVTLTVRVAALVREPHRVEVVIRSQATAFQVDHFRATCRFDAPPVTADLPYDDQPAPPPVPLRPQEDLYTELFFQGGRFQRLQRYQRLTARGCAVELNEPGPISWFCRVLPGHLCLGDPGIRDAVMHGIQPCVPDGVLLPTGIDYLETSSDIGAARSVRAQERSRSGDDFVYDIDILDAGGAICERWRGLGLRRVADARRQAGWVAPLLGPYVERRVGELVAGMRLAVAVEHGDNGHRQERSNAAMQRALGAASTVHRRPDGKPEVGDGHNVSAAHTADLTMAVAGIGTVGCDLETVTPRSVDDWRGLLGDDGQALATLLARETGEDEDTACTRVWSAVECLRKAGAPPRAPLVMDAAGLDGWVLLRSGELRTATFCAQIRGVSERVVVSVLADASL